MANVTYVPPKVWTFDAENGGEFASINRPTAGARDERKLPRGKHPFQLYSMATPNGVKATLLFEELIEKGIVEAEYDAYLVSILSGDQFGSEFVDINPNSKIPAMLDTTTTPETRVFESGSILVYLAEKFDTFLPSEPAKRTETMNWLFWQMGSTPFLGGGFGHFYNYAPEKFEYPIDRYTMEVKRQLDVLDKQLEKNTFIIGEDYTIADMAIWPWYGALVLGRLYDAAEFLQVETYSNLQRWAKMIDARPAAKRACLVNKSWGEESQQMHERHSMDDFIGKL
ncbi:glutathione-dependent disulfide-bond oxidoreductase [Alteromonas sp. 5E99-2]|uniref:glutathione-dependent disulfide-bond oxidoreductase n=1 Tax=Alteromonas sp. 5E99-2 TaxID=2817683 RepID=UPI001A98CB31|nr:glutathione-dependent disulfide-bond oxidoreductase [Alteromonas sp. 5E99-2]MBO1254279.1 glutathione-dependent disulfide-bond oxidoreductase [Alteromonas sp. 5E99-2]